MGCVWGRSNLPPKSTTVLSKPKFGPPTPLPPPIKNSWILPRIIISRDETIVSQAVLYVPTKFKQIYDLTNAEQLLRLVNYLHQRWNIIWEINFSLFANSKGTQHNTIKFHSSVPQKSMRNAEGHGNYTCEYNFWSFACRMTCKHILLPFVVNTSNYFILHPIIQGHFRSLTPLPGLLRPIEPIIFYHLPLYALIFQDKRFFHNYHA